MSNYLLTVNNLKDDFVRSANRNIFDCKWLTLKYEHFKDYSLLGKASSDGSEMKVCCTYTRAAATAAAKAYDHFNVEIAFLS